MEDHSKDEHIVRIQKIKDITHNVKQFTVDRPGDYKFEPGQATDVVINKAGWQGERRPFMFTGLNDWDHLEFTIKIYRDHKGVTNQLGTLHAGDELILHDVFGAIKYSGEGVFIAGGAGVTPFIAIFRQLQKDGRLGKNKLIFSNKTESDIILKDEFEKMLCDNFINLLTNEKTEQYHYGMIDMAYLKVKIDNFSQYFYICGPDPMVKSVEKTLIELGADKGKIVVEQV